MLRAILLFLDHDASSNKHRSSTSFLRHTYEIFRLTIRDMTH